MPRYNFALLPVDPKFQNLFAALAQTFFAANADGYLLSSDAFAHVTLCQFNAADDRKARSVFDSYADKKNENLLIEKFHFRTGKTEHSGFLWAEFLVQKKPDLCERQKKIFAHIAHQKLESLTPVKTYAPHLTLARVTRMQDKMPVLEDAIISQPITFRPAIGLTTSNGLFIRELEC